MKIFKIFLIFFLTCVLLANGDIDPLNLKTNTTYVVSEITPLMPEFNPADPEKALEEVKNINPLGKVTVISVRTKNGTPWYHSLAHDSKNRTIGFGYINSTALLGQDLKLDKKQSHTNSYSSRSSNAWYEGGNLHNASSTQWKKAKYRNKLATAGDWLTATAWKGHLNSPNDFNKLKTKAQMLVRAVNKTIENVNIEMNVRDVAALLITMSNDLGPY